jgi:hypothetical protein
VVVARDGKEVNRAYLIKMTIRNKLCLRTRRRKGVGKVNAASCSRPGG